MLEDEIELMSDTYRLVLLDNQGNEIGGVVTLPVNPNDLIVVMPSTPDGYFPQKQTEAIGAALDRLGIKGIVFSCPVAFARLERVEP